MFMADDDGMIPVGDIKTVLNRLLHYYSGRLRSVKTVAKEQFKETDEGYINAITKWQAKREAIIKVAENLYVTLKDE